MTFLSKTEFLLEITETGDFISQGKYYRHSTFENISNFINENNSILSISHNQKYLSPNSIIISGISHKNIQKVNIEKSVIFVNEFKFNKNDLTVYNSKIQFKERGLKDKMLNVIKKHISELNPLSIAFLINPEFEKNFKTRFQTAFVKHIKTAWKEVQNRNLISGIKLFKGSGIGLTPSGDDFITGLLYALVFIERTQGKNTTAIRNKVYEAAKGKNFISSNMMYHAQKGRYFKQFRDLQVAFNKNDKKTKEHLIKLINIGETSGSDILTGFYLCLKYLNKII